MGRKPGGPHAAIGDECGVSLRSVDRSVSEPKPTLG